MTVVSNPSVQDPWSLGEFETRRPLTDLPEPEMQPLFCPVVSVDDHAIEPIDLFQDRIPSTLKDDAPRLVVDGEGVPFWLIDDVPFAVTMRDGPFGHPGDEWSWQPMKPSEFREGIVDPKQRLHDMDLNGVWSSLCFPSLTWGFAGRTFSAMRNPEAGLASLRAYNDWHLEEWVATEPDRFITCQLPWLADPRVGAEEVRRNAARGFVSVTFPEEPMQLGYPELASDHWDEFFGACEETDTIINLHCGTIPLVSYEHRHVQVMMEVLFGFSGPVSAMSWLYSGVLTKFPGLRVVLTESGISWVPKLQQRLRQVNARMVESPLWIPPDNDTVDPHPADVLTTNLYFASIEDRTAFRTFDELPLDHIVMESDYPHADSQWPNLQTLIAEELAPMSAPDARMVCYETACALYRATPPPDALVAGSVVGGGATTGS
jgi:predicted TIM-barrel fold metal-dependent hydrolase